MRILIGGGDEVAFRLAEELMTQHEVTFVCPEADAQGGRLEAMDLEMVFGPITSTRILREAGIDGADLFIAGSRVDERNLVACVSAKRLGAKRTVCFLFRPEAHLPGEDVDVLKASLGIDEMVRPAEQLTEEILRIIAVPGALDVEVFVGGRVHLLRHPVEKGVPVTAGPLKDIGVPQGVVLVMARREDEVFIPTGLTQFQQGDKLTAIGNMAGINRLLSRYLRSETDGEERREATIVGGGVVGLTVAQGLEEAGWNLKVIESDRRRCEEISPLVKGLVLHGDGSDLDLLEREQIGDAPVLVAVTSNDEKNLLVSLLAKSLKVRRIITRADSLSNERLFEKVGIDVVRSARGSAVGAVLRRGDETRGGLLAELEHGEAEVLELTLPEDLPPIPLMQMKSGLFGIIGAILRGGRVIIPRGQDSVQGGDRIIVFCMRAEEDNVREFFLHRLRDLAEES